MTFATSRALDVIIALEKLNPVVFHEAPPGLKGSIGVTVAAEIRAAVLAEREACARIADVYSATTAAHIRKRGPV